MRPSSAVAAFCVLGIVAVLTAAPIVASQGAPEFDSQAVDDWFDQRDHESARDRAEAFDAFYSTCTVTLENGSEREFENTTRCVRFASDRGLINESSPWYWPSGNDSQPGAVAGWSVVQSGHVGRPIAFPVTVVFDDTRPNRPTQEYTVARGEAFHPDLSDGVRYVITVEGADGERAEMGHYEHRGRDDVTLVVCCGGGA